MKLSQAKDYLHLVQAAAEGKTIQFKSPWRGEEWVDAGLGEVTTFDLCPERYRVKPEIKYRPWALEDSVVGIIVQRKGFCDQRMIIGADTGHAILNGTTISFEKLMGEFQRTDGTPCGIPITQ